MKRFRQLLFSVSSMLLSLGSQGIWVAFLVIFLVSLFVLPLPRRALDLFLSVNLAVSLILLLRSLFVRNLRAFFSFPAVLLLTTLFRLGLNVSSSRLILLQGKNGTEAAGKVIEAFGQFIVQGNFVVGAIVFVVISLVNFLVIAKGSARVAEVAARFALDALPGRQLALDAEARTGNITHEEASLRRQMLTQESQFYGAMDGAMKFVQGDAIAGLIIAFINSVGGVAIGLGGGLTFQDAVNRFGVLSIGDGLVSILPSLLISVSAGIVVTHISGQSVGTSGNSPGSDLLGGIVGDLRAVIVAGLVLLLLSLVPGLPFIPFFSVGFLLLAMTAITRPFPEALAGSTAGLFGGEHAKGSSISNRLTANYLGYGGADAEPAVAGSSAETRAQATVRLVSIQIDPAYLVPLLSQSNGVKTFNEEFAELQDEIYRKRGIFVAAPTFEIAKDLQAGEFRVLVREQPVRSGLVVPNAEFAVLGTSALKLVGATILQGASHPIDRRSGAWISLSPPVRAALNALNSEVYSAARYIAIETIAAVFDVVDEVFGLEETKRRVEDLKRENSWLVQEVFDKGIVNYPEFTELLRRLVRERVNIRDSKLILEGIAEFSSLSFDKEDRSLWLSDLHKFLRRVLSRGIIADALAPGGSLRAFVLSPEVEEEFRAAISSWEVGKGKPPVEPEMELKLRNNASKLFAPVLERGISPVVVLCSGDIRHAVHEFFGGELMSYDWLRTIAYEELERGNRPESVGVIGAS